ncbi:MAG: hypothetical protein JSU81_11680 [Candidatus Coatesbacteria bacterium]|nr:MAG: hypothetical protein JSU81_11680 [Candidatus Coatesbacteria bacterium]
MPFRVTTLAAALLGPAVVAAVGLYVDGGVVAFRALEVRFEAGPVVFKECEPLGTSWWAGGGLAVPLWRYEAEATPYLEAVTAAGYGALREPVEHCLYRNYELSFAVAALREYAAFGVEVDGWRPYVGFGGGLAVVPWEAYHTEEKIVVDSRTEVKPVLSLPFGFEYRLADRLLLAAGVEYLTIMGKVKLTYEIEGVKTMLPDPFIFSARLRWDF